MNGTFGQYTSTDLDYADDVSVLAKLLELIVHLLQILPDDLTSFDLWLQEARDAVQNRSYWRMLMSHSAMHS